MKKMILTAAMAITCGMAAAQNTRDAQIKPADQPVSNPNQVPNYYQNNSSYNNNSMQNNKPSNGNAISFPGNGNYVDPTRYPAGTYLGNSNNQQPGQGPVNSTNSNAVHTSTGSSR
jgi:hypothetical protein